ncbi:putative epoxide hydrolase [Crucibulum laeve]|uniref:Putative epoxide hydrolase n=1 Tax=Crucibulum laeve TaxID=68775 RepID=A0A5C3LNV1_9AGAR|nr:putative epoxide hydrolase [Crucibulum laeve]
MSKTYPGMPQGVISRKMEVNGLNMHIFEALPPKEGSGQSGGRPPLLLLLHGFPELAYSWRKVILPLAQAGYHVVAPDQRGHGQTQVQGVPAGTKVAYEDDLSPYRVLNLVTDIVGLVYTLGYTSVAAVIGHDAGSRVAATCALIRPDLFKSVVVMSSPYTAPPSVLTPSTPGKSLIFQLHDALATLDPPRKHYTVYYSSPEAANEMDSPPEGLHAFLRAYYHVKSADWAHNEPYPLPANDLSAFAKLPHYYIMPLNDTMPQAVAPGAPPFASSWLTDEELAVYVEAYARTGFQPALNWYRCMTDSGRWTDDLRVFHGKRVEVPAMFVAGKSDWGTYQFPGLTDKMKVEVFEKMGEENFVLIDGAGHWVQQEKPEEVVKVLLAFWKKVS